MIFSPQSDSNHIWRCLKCDSSQIFTALSLSAAQIRYPVDFWITQNTTHNNNIKTGNGSAGCVHTVFKQSLRGDLFKWFTNIKVLYLVHAEERGDSRTVTILRSDTERNSFMLKPKCVSSPDGFPQRLNAVNVQLCCPAEFSGTDQPLIFIDEWRWYCRLNPD